MALPQLLARAHIKQRDGEEDYGEDQHEKVLHREPAFLLPASPPRKTASTSSDSACSFE
jgi:hypothetical protein